MSDKKPRAPRKTSKTAATAPVTSPPETTAPADTPASIMDAAAMVTTTDDALRILASSDINATAARLVLARSCGRSSAAHDEMQGLKVEHDAAPARSAIKTALRLQIAQLKAEMDTVRMKARGIIDTAAVEYQNRAEENKGKTVAEQIDAKRSRFLKVRNWLRENDSDWLDEQ